MTRLVPLLLAVAVFASSCANTPLAGDAANPVVETTVKPTVATTTPPAIAFSFGDVPPEILAFRSVGEGDGVCAVFDAYLDLAFADVSEEYKSARYEMLNDNDSPLSNVADGDFGAAWHVFITAVTQLDSSDVKRSDIPTNFAELNSLSTKQCGYPALDAFSAAVDCILAPSDGPGVESDCDPAADPRP